MDTLIIPVLPSQKTKNFLARLADTLGAIKLAKEALSEQFESARALALASGEEDFSGAHWKATIAEIETPRLDPGKLQKFLARHKKTIEDFQVTSTCHRLTLKPIS